jgi:hypothetical protein
MIPKYLPSHLKHLCKFKETLFVSLNVENSWMLILYTYQINFVVTTSCHWNRAYVYCAHCKFIGPINFACVAPCTYNKYWCMVFKHAFTYFTRTKFSFLVQFRTFKIKILLIQITDPNFPLVRHFPVYWSTNTIRGGRNKEKQPHRSLVTVIIKTDHTGEIS